MFARFSTMFNNGRTGRAGGNPGGGARGGGHGSGDTSPSPSPKKQCNRKSNSGSGLDTEPQSCQVDNSTAVIAKIAALYAERLMSDITLVINGQEFYAHRLILCASSDVFQIMLMNPNWSESHESRIVLQESEECAKYFEDFVKYLYTGRLKLELINVMHILTLADKYNVKDLVNLCLEYMFNHIPAAANKNHLVYWFQHTKTCGHEKIASACYKFIKWNFEMVAKSTDFPYLELDLFTMILCEDDLVVHDEYTLFLIIAYWIECQQRKFSESDPGYEERMLHVVQETAMCLRFPMMTPRQLAELLLSPVTIQYKEFLIDKMGIGMAFQTGAKDQLLELIADHPYRNSLFKPRLYTTDKWSSVLSVDNFSLLPHYQSRTLFFSTPMSFADVSVDKQIEWCLDFFPKAVQFPKCFLIIWQGTIEVPEYIIQTVRLSVRCKSEDDTEVRVQIGVLLAGLADGVEHVRAVAKRNYVFSERDKILNIDDLIPYNELIRCAVCDVNSRANPASGSGSSSGAARSLLDLHLQPNSGSHHQCSNSGNFQNHICSDYNPGSERNCYFVGQSLDCLKLMICITPINEFRCKPT